MPELALESVSQCVARRRDWDIALSCKAAPIGWADVEAAWNREIEERIAAYDRGDLQVFSAENVFAEARRNTR